MIVDYDGIGWRIITQRAHGLLAGKICARWNLKNHSIPWMETLIATAEHDDVYNEFNRDPIIDANGAPINFKATSFDLDASTMLMDMALTKSRFIALLVSRHIAFTHGKDASAKNYIKFLQDKEKIWLKEAGETKTTLNKAYQLLEFCDAFSLLICQNQVPPENRILEISSGPDGEAYTLCEIEGKLVVEPWPFNTDEFDADYEVRILKQLKFASDDEFRGLLKGADVERINITISKKLNN